MALVLAQVDDSLVLVDPVTGDAATLDLPDGVTIDADLVASIAVLKRGAAIVYAPSRNLLLTPDQELVLLVPAKPTSAPSTAAGAAGVLTGAYQHAVSFIRKDANDNVITESAMSDLSTSLTVAAKKIELTAIPVSTDIDTVTGRRLYRTLSGGTILFFLADIDDNSTTTYSDNNADASLSILPENEHRTTEIPGTNTSDDKMRFITSWKNRLWGCSENADELDNILYSDDGLPYRWGNTLVANPIGVELEGVIGLAPRRDQLGVIKRNGLWQITGDSDLSFSIVQIAFDEGGTISRRSIVVINDEAFWHGPDGVNNWGSEGVRSITDAKVRAWFTTDRYFDRSLFPQSFAKFNKIRDQYELHLVEADETLSQVWVAFNRTTRVWYGPHRTGFDEVTCAARVEGADGTPLVLVGTNSGQFLTLDPDTYHDGTETAIELDVLTPKYYGDAPDVEHTWLEMSLLTRLETQGFLKVTVTLGRQADSPQTNVMLADLVLERERLRRLGDGASLQVRFEQEDVDQPVTIHGFEVPFFEKGRR